MSKGICGDAKTQQPGRQRQRRHQREHPQALDTAAHGRGDQPGHQQPGGRQPGDQRRQQAACQRAVHRAVADAQGRVDGERQRQLARQGGQNQCHGRAGETEQGADDDGRHGEALDQHLGAHLQRHPAAGHQRLAGERLQQLNGAGSAQQPHQRGGRVPLLTVEGAQHRLGEQGEQGEERPAQGHQGGQVLHVQGRGLTTVAPGAGQVGQHHRADADEHAMGEQAHRAHGAAEQTHRLHAHELADDHVRRGLAGRPAEAGDAGKRTEAQHLAQMAQAGQVGQRLRAMQGGHACGGRDVGHGGPCQRQGAEAEQRKRDGRCRVDHGGHHLDAHQRIEAHVAVEQVQGDGAEGDDGEVQSQHPHDLADAGFGEEDRQRCAGCKQGEGAAPGEQHGEGEGGADPGRIQLRRLDDVLGNAEIAQDVGDGDEHRHHRVDADLGWGEQSREDEARYHRDGQRRVAGGKGEGEGAPYAGHLVGGSDIRAPGLRVHGPPRRHRHGQRRIARRNGERCGARLMSGEPGHERGSCPRVRAW